MKTKIFNYILHITIFNIIYIIVMFVSASKYTSSLANNPYPSKVGMYVALGVTLALEYIYLWFIARKNFFSIPIGLALILMFGVFYFNMPSTAGMGLGMFVLIKYLIGPYCLVGIAVSTVLYYANKFRTIQ